MYTEGDGQAADHFNNIFFYFSYKSLNSVDCEVLSVITLRAESMASISTNPDSK